MPKFNLSEAIALEKEGPFEFEGKNPETGKTKTFRLPQDLPWPKLQQLETMDMDTKDAAAAYTITRLLFGEKQFDEMVEYGLPVHESSGDKPPVFGLAGMMLFREVMDYVIKVHIGEDRAKKAMDQMLEERKSQTNGRKPAKGKAKTSK
ncbi:MAG: hypothetical protein M3518_06490 [Actinomycetota bacterium]|nr:hypothetical protein [Actinomycetota bacterium]